MKETIEQVRAEALSKEIKNATELEGFRVLFLGSKGRMKELFGELKAVANEDKKEVGQLLNQLRMDLESHFQALQEKLSSVKTDKESIDLSRPDNSFEPGSRHPLALVRAEIIEIFARIGYSVSEGPEIEDDWHNFSALNFPPEHPARDMQDTFFIDKGENEIALRTHTSSVQVRVMENEKPPIRTISPGRVYRNEAISARAHCFFHQVEGLYIDKEVSFADLKQTLLYFAKEMFGEKAQIRLRPSYFPFT
ncbi:MAG: phenylalanine--tRNA ligase subunit alpha, partial [Bacteroidetes bacterium]|nr:phenylalanine--tRNA ligase subunit alpha [Bacteroidota bacterium]